MTVENLLADLRSRGVEVRANGDRLRVEAPRGALTDELREKVRREKPTILRLLRRAQDAKTTDELVEFPIEEIREELAAVRIRSRLYGNVWLARDATIAAEIAAEAPGVPILTFEETLHLRGAPLERVRVLLDVMTVFPGARVIQ